MSASSRTRTAVTLPSASAASSMSWICPRPWIVATAFSLRPSVHRVGTPSRRATTTAISSSAYTLSFEPNPPPTAGAITRIFASGTPQVAAIITLRMCGICVDEVDDRVERVVVDHDGVDGVGDGVAAVGHHDGHDVAHVAGLVQRHRPVVGGLHVFGDGPGTRHGGGPGVAQVGAGEHVAHAREGERGAGVDVADAGVRERAAHHAYPQGARHLEVVDEPGLAGEQAGILLAEQAGAHPALAGRGRHRGGSCGLGRRHAGTSSDADAAASRPPAAASTDLTMLW